VLRVTSLNLRNSGANDGENGWMRRRDLVIETLRASASDLIGTQECLADQGDFLRQRLEEYQLVGVCRDDGNRAGEAAAILLRRDRFDLLDSGTFWLSPTPDVIGSKGWDAHLPRICTWVRIRDRQSRRADGSGRELLMANTHLDHAGEIARLESARLLRQWLARSATEMPAIVTGDFNAPADGIVHQTLLGDHLRDCWSAANPDPDIDSGTFHGFTGERNRERIDWILCSRQFQVLTCSIHYTARAGRFPSDHFPLTAELEWSDSERAR
jgi:endonuclease/exonuclease/phosphatase family metal-dependent hydrolase